MLFQAYRKRKRRRSLTLELAEAKRLRLVDEQPVQINTVKRRPGRPPRKSIATANPAQLDGAMLHSPTAKSPPSLYANEISPIIKKRVGRPVGKRKKVVGSNVNGTFALSTQQSLGDLLGKCILDIFFTVSFLL